MNICDQAYRRSEKQEKNAKKDGNKADFSISLQKKGLTKWLGSSKLTYVASEQYRPTAILENDIEEKKYKEKTVRFRRVKTHSGAWE